MTQHLQAFTNTALDKLVKTFQLKILNQLFLLRLPKLMPLAVTDNDVYFKTVAMYAVADVYQKVIYSK